MPASDEKLGRVSWPLAHQYDTQKRGAISPRSDSPSGPAPTRDPRIALPPATCSLPRPCRRRHSFLPGPRDRARLAPCRLRTLLPSRRRPGGRVRSDDLLEETQEHDDDGPDEGERHGDAVEVAL